MGSFQVTFHSPFELPIICKTAKYTKCSDQLDNSSQHQTYKQLLIIIPQDLVVLSLIGMLKI